MIDGMVLWRRQQPAEPPWPGLSPETPLPAVDYFRLGAVRLLQPEEVLASRLPDGVAEVAAYCNTLAWVGSEYFGRLGRDFGSLGVLITVGIKPNRRTKLWCEVVDGEIPDDVWDVFVGLLRGAGDKIRPEVTAAVALTLECLLGAGPSITFPVTPAAWEQAISLNTRGLGVPDELFEIVFAD